MALLGDVAGLLGDGRPVPATLQQVAAAVARGTLSDVTELRVEMGGRTLVFRHGDAVPTHTRRLAVRLRMSGTPLGEISVCRERAYQDADRLFLETVASYLSTALQAARARAVQEHAAAGAAASWSRVRSLIGGVLMRATPPEPPAAVPDERRLSALTDDLVTLARVETQDAVATERVAVAPWLARVVARRLERAQGAGRVLRLEAVDPDLSVSAIAAHLEAALDHLICNAIAYSPAGSVVTVRALRDRAEVLLCVDDEGPGIPSAERDRVYERFFRGRAALLMDTPGNGLGLAIVSEVAATHGGHTFFRQAPAGGTRFVLALPAVA